MRKRPNIHLKHWECRGVIPIVIIINVKNKKHNCVIKMCFGIRRINIVVYKMENKDNIFWRNRKTFANIKKW